MHVKVSSANLRCRLQNVDPFVFKKFKQYSKWSIIRLFVVCSDRGARAMNLLWLIPGLIQSRSVWHNWERFYMQWYTSLLTIEVVCMEEPWRVCIQDHGKWLFYYSCKSTYILKTPSLEAWYANGANEIILCYLCHAVTGTQGLCICSS